MTIFIGSRYENESVQSLKDQQTGSVRDVVFATREVLPSDGFRYHLWAETDRIDRVTQEYLFDADRWWEVMDANPEILNPFDIAPGQVIRIPNG